MRVVITGGAGFIGASTIDAFINSGDDVTVIDTKRRIDRVQNMMSRTQSISLDDITTNNIGDFLSGAELLIHLAWSSEPADSMTGMVEDARTNIVGSLDLFRKAAEAGVQKIIFASSGGTVYGNTDHLPIGESEPLNPISAYGVSKVAVERYLQLIAYHHELTGVSLRIGNPYGPYQLAGLSIGLIANFIQRVRNKQALRIYGTGEIVRDYIWVDDVASAFAAAAKSPLASGEYNIGSGEGYSINSVAKMVESEYHCENNREYLTHRSFDAEKVILDTSKFRRFTEWRPSVEIGDGIKLMVDYLNSVKND